MTPLGKLNRVQIELQAERTILDQDYVRPMPPMILSVLYLLIAIGGAVSVIRLGPRDAAILTVVFAVFWFELALLAFRLYNIVLPLPSFAMLVFGTYVMGFLALYWDLEPELPHGPAPHEI